MRFVSRLAAVALPPALTIIALVACGKSPTEPDKVVLGVTGCPSGYVCTDKPHEGKAVGVPPTPPSGGVNNGGSNSGSGGATPTAAPGSTPSGSPTVPCPASFSFVATGLPGPLLTSLDSFPAAGSNFPPKCALKDVKVTIHVTTVTGFVDLSGSGGSDYTGPTMLADACGAGVGFSGCGGGSTLFDFTSTNPASGNQLGTSCSNFIFNSAATTGDFDPATAIPPYAGTYHYGGMNVGGDVWFLGNFDPHFHAGGFPPDAILQCARVDVTTQILP